MPLFEAPLESKPQIHNPDGSVSTERSITISADGLFYNIPTIVQGQQYTPEQAWQMFMSKKLQPLGVYRTQEEAEQAATARSSALGELLRRLSQDAKP